MELFDNLRGFLKRPARLFLAKFADMGGSSERLGFVVSCPGAMA
jgi:hypothetical protein